MCVSVSLIRLLVISVFYFSINSNLSRYFCKSSLVAFMLIHLLFTFLHPVVFRISSAVDCLHSQVSERQNFEFETCFYTELVIFLSVHVDR